MKKHFHYILSLLLIFTFVFITFTKNKNDLLIHNHFCTQENCEICTNCNTTKDSIDILFVCDKFQITNNNDNYKILKQYNITTKIKPNTLIVKKVELLD